MTKMSLLAMAAALAGMSGQMGGAEVLPRHPAPTLDDGSKGSATRRDRRAMAKPSWSKRFQSAPPCWGRPLA